MLPLQSHIQSHIHLFQSICTAYLWINKDLSVSLHFLDHFFQYKAHFKLWKFLGFWKGHAVAELCVSWGWPSLLGLSSSPHAICHLIFCCNPYFEKVLRLKLTMLHFFIPFVRIFIVLTGSVPAALRLPDFFTAPPVPPRWFCSCQPFCQIDPHHYPHFLS